MIRSESEARAWLAEHPECGEQTWAKLKRFLEMLAIENERQNLVSASSLSEFWRRHVVDSAQLLASVPRGTSPWLDLGTGAGFPGLVAAVFRPEMPITLVESRRKRVDWLKGASESLELTNVHIADTRLELVPTTRFAVISARAFAPLERLLALSVRFSTSDTIWLLPKGRSAQTELDSLEGWTHTFHVEPSLTDNEAGVIVGNMLGRAQKGLRT